MTKEEFLSGKPFRYKNVDTIYHADTRFIGVVAILINEKYYCNAKDITESGCKAFKAFFDSAVYHDIKFSDLKPID